MVTSKLKIRLILEAGISTVHKFFKLRMAVPMPCLLCCCIKPVFSILFQLTKSIQNNWPLISILLNRNVNLLLHLVCILYFWASFPSYGKNFTTYLPPPTHYLINNQKLMSQKIKKIDTMVWYDAFKIRIEYDVIVMKPFFPGWCRHLYDWPVWCGFLLGLFSC